MFLGAYLCLPTVRFCNFFGKRVLQKTALKMMVKFTCFMLTNSFCKCSKAQQIYTLFMLYFLGMTVVANLLCGRTTTKREILIGVTPRN